MSGISGGAGFFSGIDTASIVNQLIAASSRPKVLAQQRIVQLQGQQAAYLDINSRLGSLRTAAAKFNAAKVFQAARATSSLNTSLTATATAGATPGVYSFIVDRVVGTQQLLTRGFADRDTTSVGASRFVIEPVQGRLDTDTNLSELNGGQGVSRGRIIVTDSAGANVTVDLSRVSTVQEVLEAINSAGNGAFSARVQNNRFVITDNAGGSGSLRVGSAAGYTTAASLGIEGTASAPGSGGAITGASVYALGGATALRSLNDGNGIRISTAAGASTPDIMITTRDGSSIAVDIGNMYDAEARLTASAVANIQGVIERINTQSEGKVTASIAADGVSLRIVDNTTGDSSLVIADAATSGAATDLGVAGTFASGSASGRRVFAGLNTTLVANLRGGRGLPDGEMFITDRNGAGHSLSLPTGGAVSDLLDAIRTQTGGAVVAELDSTGTGILLRDTTGGSGPLEIAGAAAEALGIATEDGGVEASTVGSGRLQRRYIAESTLLSSLNGGSGVGTGSFEITNSSGLSRTINIGSSARTIGDVIQQINGANAGVTARVNDNGDGIVIEVSDDPPGNQKIKIRDLSGTVARSLNLAREAADAEGQNLIDGSFERVIEFTAGDTLDAVVRKINEAGAGITASIINDGAGATPFRISLTSQRSGSAGRFTIDTGGLDLGLQTLSEGRDARIFYGSPDAARGVLLSSSSNTFDGVIANVRIDALAPSENPVTISVSRDAAAIEAAVGEFVTAFNGVVSRIQTLTAYNEQTRQRGTLLGDSLVQQIRSELFNTINGRPDGVSGPFQSLAQVGLRVGTRGELSVDNDALRAALDQDPQAVADLFAAKVVIPPEPRPTTPDPDNPGAFNSSPPPIRYSSLGVAEQIVQLVERYTSTADGVMRRRNESMDTQIRLQQDRIRSIDTKLAAQRERLERQFIAMERAIGQLQGQNGALSSLSQIAANFRR